MIRLQPPLRELSASTQVRKTIRLSRWFQVLGARQIRGVREKYLQGIMGGVGLKGKRAKNHDGFNFIVGPLESSVNPILLVGLKCMNLYSLLEKKNWKRIQPSA